MDLLEGLNAAQRAAVVHEDGPLVVLAGPGTGKTRVITHRIARLILDSGAAPESIVALTFTVKAAEQMRARLRELLGVEHAAKAEMVTVSTFHGLGQRLVRRFGDILNVAPNAELMDSAQRKQVLRELIVVHGLYPDAAAAGLRAAVEQASDLIDECGNQGVTAADAERHAGEWAKRLAKNAEGLDATALTGEKARCERFGRMVRLYGMYGKVCRERGLISFNDLIMLPVELLRTSKQAAAILRAEYRHAVVDEYQDVNAAQIEMLKGLFPAGIGGGPDLCVVGDDDQAIYGFRGADDRAFVKFDRAWPKHTVVELRESYRSEQAVLDIANAVIARATGRYAPDKVVERPADKRDEAPKAGTVAQGVILEDNAQDGEVIAAMLRGMRAKEPELDWSRYAVLSRAHSDLERVAGALELEGIPFVRRAGSGAKSDEGVQDVLAFSRMLLEPEAGGVAEVQRLLARPPHLVEGRELLEWQKQYLAALSHFENGNPDSPNPGSYLRWLVEYHGDVPAVMKVAAQEATLRPLAVSGAAGEVIYRIVTEIGAAHVELLSGRDRARRVVALAGLIRQARLAEARLQEPRGLAEFLAYYGDLSDKEQEGVDPREQVDGGGEGSAADDAGAVQLLTAHSAKGLEFDTVFVIKANPSGFGKKGSDGDSEMPEALVDRAGDTRDAKARAAAESRRLFYVAVTRAERRLVVMSTVTKKGSTGEHYFEELTRGAGGEPVLAAVEAADVLKDSARAPLEAVEHEGRAYKALEARREVFERARRDARRAASGALDSADRRGLAGAGPAEAEKRLAGAAIRLAVIAAEEAGEKAEWIAKDRIAAAYREELRVELGAAVGGVGASTSSGFIVPRAPLHLSYTYINDYLECPRCFYCKHVLRIPEPPSQEQSIGTVVHTVLAEFYGWWMKADAEGKRPPGLKELVELGEKRLYTMMAGQAIDAGLREQLKDQLRIAHEVLHNPEAQIIERPEWEFSVPLVLAGVRHDLRVQIDRIEQVEGGYRIVDYKTGQDWKKLTEPKADDLQMGVYALALDEKLGGGAAISGTAEYWLLASGQRGVLGLDKLKREKVRGTIEKAAAGILAGEFGKGSKCRNRCEFLGP